MKGYSRMVASLGRSFNKLWAATGAANLADGMALFSLPLLALAVGASPGGVAAVTATLTLAWPLFGLHAGMIVDRVQRRTLLVTVNVVRVLALGTLTWAYATDILTLALILVVALALGVTETLVDTALTATIPLVVEYNERPPANARIEATINLTNQLAGPPLAGLLAGITLALVTGISAILYAFAAIALATMSLRPQAFPSSSEPVRERLVSGIRFLWGHPVLRQITLFTASMNLVWSAALSLVVVYAVAPGPLGLSEAEYGLVMTAMAAGGLAASVVVERLRARFGVSTLMIADFVGTVLLVAPVAVGAGVWPVAAGLVIAGGGASVWRILGATIRQNLSPPEILGRVYAASRVISWGVIPVGAGLAGLGAEIWGLQPVFGAATLVAVAALVAFTVFALRTDLSAIFEARDEPVQ